MIRCRKNGVVMLLCAPHATYAFLQAGCRHAESPEGLGGLYFFQVLFTNSTYQWMYHPFQSRSMGKAMTTCKHRLSRQGGRQTCLAPVGVLHHH